MHPSDKVHVQAIYNVIDRMESKGAHLPDAAQPLLDKLETELTGPKPTLSLSQILQLIAELLAVLEPILTPPTPVTPPVTPPTPAA